MTRTRRTRAAVAALVLAAVLAVTGLAGVGTATVAAAAPSSPAQARVAGPDFGSMTGHVAYLARGNLWVLDVAQRSARQYTKGNWAIENLAMSANGARIAVTVRPQSDLDQAGIYVFDRKSGKGREILGKRLRDRFVAVGAPTWSPDGKQLVFVGYDDDRFEQRLYSVRPDGTGLRRMRECDCMAFGNPLISPDGKRIAYQDLDDLIVLNRQGGLVKRVRVGAELGWTVGEWSWTRDSRGFLYDNNVHLFRTTLAGGTGTQLTPDDAPGYSSPVPSPNGRWITSEFRNARDRVVLRFFDAGLGLEGGTLDLAVPGGDAEAPDWTR